MTILFAHDPTYAILAALLGWRILAFLDMAVHPARSAHDDPAGDNAPLTSRGQSGPDGPTAGGG